MSAAETVLNLLDSYWFEYGIFSPKPSLCKVRTDPFLEVDAKPKLNRIKTLMKKSSSDQFLSSKDCSNSSDSSSPNSVLVPKLQTILSRKEVEEFKQKKPSRTEENRKCRRKKNSSRSLSELEFEELKGFMDLGFVFSDEDKDSNLGFMDLGFVFSDEDKDSNLVSIIPGLQRLGAKGDGKLDGKWEEKGMEKSVKVSRPYLSEAWDVLEDEKRMKNRLMIDWRIPDFGNEMELKDHLRFWAHTVASTVR
ncbi:Hypothetical predicted protein [Olea europaea subsp. europaea]|uniref:Uncharacterized protein n=1 Tax=Olea europaea subsp. europaea TaxID=158383 RepID=A0A8S0T478_OLEEU|nr:Hypothetical predicted protein [Olea europaea subsp. europaea]